MHPVSYHGRAHKQSLVELALYQQGRAQSLYSISRTFRESGNLREAVRFQDMGASASAAAREALGIE